MQCKEVHNLLIEFMGGDLTDDIRVLVEDHLSNCERCSQEHALLLVENKIFAAIPQVEPTQFFDASFFNTLNQEKARALEKKKSLWARVLSAPFFAVKVPAIALALILAFTLIYNTGTIREKPDLESYSIASSLGMLAQYEVVLKLDLLENYDFLMNPDLPKLMEELP
jgi:hypothetical protein